MNLPRKGANAARAAKEANDLKLKKIAGLAKAQRELFEKRRDIDLAFLHGIPARSGPVFTVSVAVVGFIASAAVLGMGNWLSAQPTITKIAAAAVLFAVLISLGIAVWSGLESLRPSDFDETPARSNFIELALPQIGDENYEADIDAFMAELTRTEIQNNKVWIQKRLRGLTVAVLALRIGFILAIVLVASSVIITISGSEQKNAGQPIINSYRANPTPGAGPRSPDPKTGDPPRTDAGNGDKGGRPPIRDKGDSSKRKTGASSR